MWKMPRVDCQAHHRGRDDTHGRQRSRACPFYVGAAQFDCWSGCQIIVDVATEGGGDSFSLEAADGVRFTVLSQPLTDREIQKLAKIETVDARASTTENSPAS